MSMADRNISDIAGDLVAKIVSRKARIGGYRAGICRIAPSDPSCKAEVSGYGFRC